MVGLIRKTVLEAGFYVSFDSNQTSTRLTLSNFFKKLGRETYFLILMGAF